MGIILIIGGIFMIGLGIVLFSIREIPMTESKLGKYVIEQVLETTGDFEALAAFPRVKTYVWHNGEIVMNWYDHIDSDSTTANAKKRAEEWIKMIRTNEDGINH